ncbi:polycystin-1-like protein 2 [Procambarus clarkii]|uniref:polycystin-1-like protein 2 n=1 Tax=Procambarus clarkii TaxID=6728 RepID=UPI0037436640
MERRPATFYLNCIVPLTVEHILVECPDFQDEHVSCFPIVPRGHLSLDRILGNESTHSRKHKRLDDETLERLRKERQQEIDMWKIMTEIVAYSIFLWVFLTITYGSRDPNTFLLHQSLSQEFLNEGRTGIDFTKVTNRDLLWRYLYHGLLPNLRAGKYYNDKPPYGLRGFLNDQSNRIMGYATIRQIRTKGTECRVPTIMRPLIKDCDGYGSISDEDSQDYCGGWIPLNNFTGNFSQCLIPEFRYTTAAVLNSYPIWGRREWYGGGGYVIHLRASTDAILQKFQELQSNQWIDHKTRAVLIEFSVYNSQSSILRNIMNMRVDRRLASFNGTADNLRYTSPGSGNQQNWINPKRDHRNGIDAQKVAA